MNWTWIAIFSLTGVVVGLLTSLVGLPGGLEPAVWVGFYLLWGVAVVKRDLPPFWTPFIGSVGSGVLVGITQFALWTSYVASNPWYADQIADSEANLGQILGFGVGMGIGWGLFVGGTCRAGVRGEARG